VPLAVPKAEARLAAIAQDAVRRFSHLPDGVLGLAPERLLVTLPFGDDVRTLLQAPLVAAEVATGARPALTAQQHLQLIALRAADPIWFNAAMPAALTLAMELPR